MAVKEDRPNSADEGSDVSSVVSSSAGDHSSSESDVGDLETKEEIVVKENDRETVEGCSCSVGEVFQSNLQSLTVKKLMLFLFYLLPRFLYHRTVDILGVLPYFVVKTIEISNFILGLIAYSVPFLFVIFGFAVCLLALAGQFQADTETQYENLWIPSGTQEIDDRDYVDDKYGTGGRASSIIAVAKGSFEHGVLSRECMLDLLTVHQRVMAIKYGTNHDFAAICKRQGGGAAASSDISTCSFDKLWGLWNYSASVFNDDSKYLITLANGGSTGGIALNKIFANLEMKQTVIPDNSNAAKISWTLSGTDEDEDAALDWESYFIDLMRDIDLPHLTIYVSASRSFGDALGSEISKDLNFLFAGIATMFIYVAIFLGGILRKNRMVLSVVGMLSVLVGLFGGIGLAGWLGVVSTPSNAPIQFLLLGIGVDDIFVMVNSWDVSDKRSSMRMRTGDMLKTASTAILTTSLTTCLAFFASSSSSLPAIRSFALTAALAVIMVFFSVNTIFVGTFVLDARIRRHFSCCCLFNFHRVPVYQDEKKKWRKRNEKQVRASLARDFGNTEDVKSLVEHVENGENDNNNNDDDDMKRKALDSNEEFDAACMEKMQQRERNVQKKINKIEGDHEGDENDQLLSGIPHTNTIVHKVLNLCGSIMVTDLARFSIISVFVISAIVGAYNITNLEEGLTQLEFIPEDTYVEEYLVVNDNYYSNKGAPVSLYTKQLDYSTSEKAESTMKEYQSLMRKMEQSKWTTEPYFLWVDAFLPTFNSTTDDFFASLSAWLNLPQNSFWRKDIVFDDNTNPTQIISSRGQLQTIGTGGIPEDELALMEDLQDTAGTSSLDAFAFQFVFIITAQWRVLFPEAVRNIITVNVVIFAVSLVLLMHPGMSILVVLVVISVDLNLVSWMILWGIKINSISLLLVVMAVGLAVDYTVHICHYFMYHAKGDQKTRARHSLVVMGKPVINGAVTTFIGIIWLAFSNTLIFSIFLKMFVLVVFLSLLHALLLVPTLLSLLGPTYRVTDTYSWDKVMKVVKFLKGKIPKNEPTSAASEEVVELGSVENEEESNFIDDEKKDNDDKQHNEEEKANDSEEDDESSSYIST